MTRTKINTVSRYSYLQRRRSRRREETRPRFYLRLVDDVYSFFFFVSTLSSFPLSFGLCLSRWRMKTQQQIAPPCCSATCNELTSLRPCKCDSSFKRAIEFASTTFRRRSLTRNLLLHGETIVQGESFLPSLVWDGTPSHLVAINSTIRVTASRRVTAVIFCRDVFAGINRKLCDPVIFQPQGTASSAFAESTEIFASRRQTELVKNDRTLNANPRRQNAGLRINFVKLDCNLTVTAASEYYIGRVASPLITA